MFTIQFEKAGEPAEVLSVKEVETPKPSAGEVLIRVKACPINPSDTMFVRGLYGLKPEFPNASAGFEGAGEVAEVGEGASIALGTKVMFTHRGTWAEYVVVSERAIVPVPEHWDYEIACQSFVNPFTAWAMLHEANLQEGDWLLLTAGGSTFAQLVIQLAQSRGIKTIATLRRDDQIEQLKALGVTATINTDKQKIHHAVNELTEGKGAKACFEAVGGETGTQALKSLAENGQMWIYGLLSMQNSTLDNGLMIFKSLKIHGFWLTHWMAQSSSEAKKQMRHDVFGLLGSEALKVEVEARYSPAEIKEAVAHAERPGRKGKVLIKF
jgi:NADPH:quinone reductase-like Zn-dependent oxidoreductase